MNNQENRKTDIDISIVVPIHNEEKHIELLHKRLTSTLEALDRNYEIIFVDDGSHDNSYNLLKKIHCKDKRVSVIQLTRNFGQHPAIMAGFKFAGGSIIVTSDGDLQNPPEEIPKLVEKIDEGYGVASGSRVNRQDAKKRLFLSRIGNLLVARLTGLKMKDCGCMLKAYRRDVVDHLLKCPEKFKTIPALVAWISPFSIIEVEIRHDSRKHGSSNYNLYDLLRLAFGLVVGYSTFPLQVISLLGMAITGAGFVGGLVVLTRLLFNSGTPSILFISISAFMFFYGLLLFAIGLTGEYIGRIFVEVQGRPYYIVNAILE